MAAAEEVAAEVLHLQSAVQMAAGRQLQSSAEEMGPSNWSAFVEHVSSSLSTASTGVEVFVSYGGIVRSSSLRVI